MGMFLKLSRFALMPCLGIGQGMLPLVGYNYGAGNKERVGEVAFKAGLSGFLWSGLCGLLLCYFRAKSYLSLIQIRNS